MKKLLFILLCFSILTFGSSARIIEVAPAGAWGVLGISGGGAVAVGDGPVQVQKKSATNGAATIHQVVADSTPTEGNLMILVISSDTAVSTYTGWTLDGTALAVDWVGVAIFYQVAGAGESATMELELSSSGAACLAYFEYSGMSASPFDVAAGATNEAQAADTDNNSHTISTGTTASTAQNDEILVAVVGYNDSTFNADFMASWDNSFVEEYDLDSGAALMAVAIRTVSSTGTYIATATSEGVGFGDGHQCGVIAAFKVGS